MSSKSIHIRPLTEADIPAVLDISKPMWNGEDYIPSVIQEWIHSPKSVTYGIFTDKFELAAFARVNWLTPTHAWLEGGRVRVELQKQGYGRLLTEWGLNYAMQNGAKVAQYDTSSLNKGSRAIAKEFGFYEKFRMANLFWHVAKKPVPSSSWKSLPIINVKDAFTRLQKVPNGPKTELNMGWSYIPFTLDQLNRHTKRWIAKDAAVMHIFSELNPGSIREIPDHKGVWLITYGSEKAVVDLVKNSLELLHNQGFEKIGIFIPIEIEPVLRQLGFEDYDKEPESVILFEKIL